MGALVKYDENVGKSVGDTAKDIVTILDGVGDQAGTFWDNAEGEIEGIRNKVKDKIRTISGDIEKIKQSQNNNSSDEFIEQSKKDIQKLIDEKRKYEGYLRTISTNETKIKGNVNSIQNTVLSKAKEYFNKFPTQISKIEEYITNYNEQYGKVEFVGDDGSALGTIQIVDNANGGEIQQLTFTITDPNDPNNSKSYTIGELLNAFYTYQGMTMSSLVEGKILADALGITYTDEYRKQIMASTNSLIDFASGAHLFGIATSNDINNTASAVGVDITNLNDNLLSGLTDKQKYGDALLNLANGTLSDGTKLAASVLGAYALTGFINANAGSDSWQSAEKPTIGSEYELPTDNGEDHIEAPTDSSPSNPYYPPGGGGGTTVTNSPGNGGTPKKTKKKTSKKTEKPTTKPTTPKTEKPTGSSPTPTENATPGTITPTEGTTIPLTSPTDTSNLPTEVKPEIEKDYDALARAKYEEQGSEAISEHRAKLTEEANQLFDAEDKTALKEKLKGYGYSDEDIETIIQDRNLTVNAIISGDQKQELTKIANDLAAQDNVEGFDTKYDDNINATSLTDGTASQLLANRSEDKGIQTAEAALVKAEEDYTTKAATATTAIAAVTTAKQELDNVVKSIDDEIKTTANQWDKATLDSYNKDVETLYNNTVNEVGNKASNWTSADWEKVSNAKANKETELAYNKGKDLTTWTSQQKSDYESSINDIKASYVKKFGKDTSKWSSGVKEAYKKATDKVYKNKAVEIGKTKLDADDRKAISEAETNVKNSIIKEKGDQSKWTAEEKKAYQTKLEELQKKYGDKTSTEPGKSNWTDEQARKYNEAMEKYNKAVEEANKAVEDANNAKTTYGEKKQAVADAEKAFYESIASANKKTAEDSQLKTDISNNAIVSDDRLTGNLDIGSAIVFDENGASISAKPISVDTQSNNNTVNSNGIIENQIITEDTVVTQPTNTTVTPTNTTITPTSATTPVQHVVMPTNGGIVENEVVTEDEYVNNSDLPVIDANSGNSGVVNNIDIKF